MTPAHPDAFELWTGDAHSMPDWSLGQALTCAAVPTPTPGETATVADTLPDPPLGSARNYQVASVNGMDSRLGRQFVAGAFSARDPSSLPVCSP